MSHFASQRVWIIGASAGIGEALARAFAAQGASLILSARDKNALEAIAADCPGSQVIPLDLARPETLDAAIDLLSRSEPLDVVVCTAASYHPSPISGLDREQTEELIRVNLLGMCEVARLCPPLIRDGGQLVLFGSVAGYFGLPKGQAYSATKAAVNNLAETLRLELTPRVDVRLVCPGFVRSRLTDKNDFRMPAIIEPEQAAARVLRGLRSSAFEIHFPRRFTLIMKLLRALPYALSLMLVRRIL